MRKFDMPVEGEKVILKAKSRWTSYILPGVILAAYIWLFAVTRRQEDSFFRHAVLIAFGLWGVRFFAPRLATYLVLTDKRIYGEAGVFVTRTLDVPLDKVGGVYVEMNPLGKITGRGTVTVTTAGSQFKFPYIPSAVKFRDALMAEVENAQNEDMRRQSIATAEALAAVLRRRGGSRRHNGNDLL